MKKVSGGLLVIGILLISIHFVTAALFFYDPSSTILNQWNRGTGITHVEVIDSARQPFAPGTTSFIASRMGDGHQSEFLFNPIIQSEMDNITLWVYVNTGNTAQFTFELRQGATTRCSQFVAGSTANTWLSCTWTNPSGALDDLRVFFSEVTRASNGGPTNAIVYATYLEVDTGNPPPVVTLNNPANGDVVTSTPFNFQFTAVDETYSTIDSCMLYTNISGSWQQTSTITNVANNTLSGFSQSPLDGVYSWNVLCDNSDKSSFAEFNRTVTVNAVAPLIENASLNESNVRQNRSVRFSVDLFDSYGIDSALFTLEYPNNSLENITLTDSGSGYFADITNTADAGEYEIVLIWANDTLGQINTNTDVLSFQSLTIPPEDFNLTSPESLTETTNLTTTFSWQQTATPDFNNYTLLLSKDNFNAIQYTYSTDQIINTSITILTSLDEDSTYSWKVIAYDLFSNSKNSTQIFTYITDNTAPSVSLSNPPNNSFVTSQEVNFSYTPNDVNTIDYCELYGNFSGTWSLAQTNISVAKATTNSFSQSVSEGPNVWNVQCFDLAGNNAFAATNRTVILDTTGPIVSLVSPANDSLINDTNIVNFEAEAFDELTTISSCSLIVNGSVEQTLSSITENVVFEFEQFLVNDVYTWQVSCLDVNGNEGFSEVRDLEVESLDNDPPVIGLVSPVNNAYLSSGSVLFNYSVSDATGIGYCALYVDDVLEQNDTSVENFEYNTFNVNGLVEDSFIWRVECVDNSSELNLGISNNRSFIVDLSDPVVVLDSPVNDAFLNFSSINFNHTPTDTYLSSCQLYTNESGIFESVQTNSSPTSASSNTFSYVTNNGVFVWNVLCFDLSGRSSFASSNRTISVDTISPTFLNLTISPSSPVDFDNRLYWFNITWFDNFEVDTVLLEHNFTGSLVNTSIAGVGDLYSFNVSDLNASSYRYRWFANDSIGNQNKTTIYVYTVSQSNSNLSLFLNSSEENISINESQTVNISAELTTPSTGNISLFLDNILIYENTSPLSFLQQFQEPGTYNLTASFSGSQNYISFNKTLVVEVQDITPPNITLVAPDNNSFVSSGLVTLAYNVSDRSDIDSCELYLDNTLTQTNTNIQINTTQTFIEELTEGTYEWRVECVDNASNRGVSQKFIFEAVETGAINLSVQTSNTTIESGELITFNVTTKDIFDNSLLTNILIGVIDTQTTSPWWNSSWTKRKNILLNETQGVAQTNSLTNINISNIEFNDCQNELRIINNSANFLEIPFKEISSGVDWCEVVFYTNLSANEVNNNDFYVYYDNPLAPSTDYNVVTQQTTSFYASQAAADEGTPTNVANIIGFNDATSATLTQGGGTGTHSAHGRSFIDSIPGLDINTVRIRYRYEVTAVAGDTLWELRYSLNSGGSYANAFSGNTITGITTSSWLDITSQYPNLNWDSINNTRLQARISKSGGGSNTLEFYWIEVEVNYELAPQITQTSLSQEQRLINYSNTQTDEFGLFTWDFQQKNLTPGNYTGFVVSTKTGFETASNITSLIINTDITLPEITLISPTNNSKIDKEPLNLSFEVFDNNINTCTLYLGISELQQNATISVSNGFNSFENINLDYEDYIWNVLCNDTFENSDFSQNNFTFTIKVPDPVINTNLSNEVFLLEWEPEQDAESYNIYIINDFEQGFESTPNITGITNTSWEINVSDSQINYYKITAVVGSRESEVGGLAGFYTASLVEGFNFLSFPFLIQEYELKTSQNDGLTFEFDDTCLLSIWKYNSSSNTFLRTDFVNEEFVPSTGSESFTSLDANKGYLFETNSSCNFKFGGRIPTKSENITLQQGLNMVSWSSVIKKPLSLSTDDAILTSPEFDVRTIFRLNSTNQQFESTVFLFDGDTPQGWWPFSYTHFTELVPGEAYYFNSDSSSTWIHEPLN